MVRPLPWLIAAAFWGRLDRRTLRVEVARQCQAFARCFDRPPDFVDGHQHVHQLPGVREALLDELAALGWRPWLRGTRAPSRLTPVPGARVATSAERLKARLVAALGGAALAREAGRRDLRTSAHLLGVRRFDNDSQRYAQALAAWLATAGEGDVLMTHPSRRAIRGDAISAAREMEFSVLAGPVLAALLYQQLVSIVPMRAIDPQRF